MMKKLFVLLIKYMPTIQLVGMLVNNTLYKYDVNLEFDYIGDFLEKDIVTVNSVIVSFLFVRFRTSCRSRLQITDLLTNLKLNDYEIRRRNGRKELRTSERWE